MSVATVSIISDGAAMEETYQVVSLMVTKEVNRIPAAEIRLIDGDSAKQEFAVSDAAFFELGATVEIKLRYEGETDHTVFGGIVVRQSVEAGSGGSYLTVQLRDPAITLTQIRRSAVFADKSDADVVKAVVTGAKLTTGDVPATKPTHEEVVQYRSTDWDFIVSRADVNGLLVVADGGEISLAPIDVTGAAAHTFEFGLTPIYDFEIELDGARQVEGVESVGWDPATQAMTTAAVATSPGFATGNRDGKKVAGNVGVGTYTLSTPAVAEPDELRAWADSRLARNRMALVRGRLAVPGVGDLAVLDVIEIAGVGARFNGTTIVTGLVHRLSDRGWITDVQFGLSPNWFCAEPGLDEPHAAGLLPSVGGLQIGVVAAFEDDPAGEFRVRVVVPGIEPDTGLVWARLAAPDAGAGRGWIFRPEIGDEVVLGFLNDDPRRPIVLGSFFSSGQAPPEDLTVDEDNISKGIVSRSGSKLIFTDDEKPSVSLETPGANGIVLSDDAEEITITDQHGNTITMSKDGVAVASAKDLEIKADGDVTITAGGNVEIKGSKVDVK